MSGMETRTYTEKVPTVRETLREMGSEMKSKAKNFALIGASFSASHCLIEKVHKSSRIFTSCERNYVLYHCLINIEHFIISKIFLKNNFIVSRTKAIPCKKNTIKRPSSFER